MLSINASTEELASVELRLESQTLDAVPRVGVFTMMRL